MTRPATVMIGVGNRYRSDDAAGPMVADKVGALRLKGVTVVETDGEPTRMVDAWEGAALAVVVDAVHSGAAPPGSIHRIEAPLPGAGRLPAAPPASSHGLGLGDAYALGAALGRLPERLVVYGVEGETFAAGTELSAAVAGAIDKLVAGVAGELTGAPRCA